MVQDDGSYDQLIVWSFKSYLIQRTELSVRCFELVIQRFMHMQMTYGAVFYRDKWNLVWMLKLMHWFLQQYG